MGELSPSQGYCQTSEVMLMQLGSPEYLGLVQAQFLVSLGEVIIILLRNIHWSPLPHRYRAFHQCCFITLGTEFQYREGNHLDPNLFLFWFC